MASMDADHMTLRTELPELTQVPITASNPAIEMHRRPGHHRHDTDDELVKRNSRSSDEKVYPDEKAAFSDEKNDAYITTTDEEYDHTIAYDVRSGLPLPDIPGAPEEGSELTFRAVIIGSGLGAIVGASNIYLGLKTGWTFAPSLFGAIFGFAILKSISNLPAKFGGGYFGPKENVVCQTAATAAGGFGIIFIGGIPAMYQLGLLDSPSKDIGKLIGFCAVSAFYGMTFALPLRKWYILRLKLVFPTPTATALTIRTLHLGRSGAEAARKKVWSLVISFIASISLRIGGFYAPGVLWDWHVFVWLHNFGWKAAIAGDNWNWYFEWTPAFLAAGMLAGLNASWSFYGGSILAWGIMGPSIVHTHLATGKDLGDGIVSYASMNIKPSIAKTNQVSPRYWLLWVGVLIMIVCSFAELAINLFLMFRTYRKERRENAERHALIEDPVAPKEQVPWKIWGPALAVTIVVQVVVLSKVFNMNAGIAILSIILGFLWSFIAVQSAGVTDVNPVSTTAKCSQLVVGGITQSFNYPVNSAGWAPKAALQNLWAGCVAGGAAAQSCDMVSDLKTAHLLKASPRKMYYAQACGALVSVFLVPGLFVLFASAYPCILDLSADTCAFSGPSIAAWRAVSIAVASKTGLPLPASSGYTAIGLSIAGVIILLLKYFVVPQKYGHWVPNPVAAGLAFTLPQSNYSAAMAAGSLFAYFWQKKFANNYTMYVFPVAAGMISGEGIGGLVGAILTIANIGGNLYGSGVGCPGGEYCG